ncbi:hypothetical protein ACFLV4_04560 [Chloroflexota bacterium]
MLSEYQCVKCSKKFIAAHYVLVRLTVGRTVKHCGEPARWLRNLENEETESRLNGVAPLTSTRETYEGGGVR